MILKKLATSPLTSQTMLKMGVNESVWGHNIVGGSQGGGGGLRDEPYVTITWKGFPTVSQVL